MARAWCAANRGKVGAWSRIRFERLTPEERAAKWKRWAKDNTQHLREYRKRYAEAHPESELKWRAVSRARCVAAHRMLVQVRRARIRGAPGRCTAAQAAARIAVYGGKCAYCGWRAAVALDHMIPVACGGSNWPANLIPACKTCNSRKSAKRPHEWAEFSGFHLP